jgi:flagellar basal body-associated protein FliL
MKPVARKHIHWYWAGGLALVLAVLCAVPVTGASGEGEPAPGEPPAEQGAHGEPAPAGEEAAPPPPVYALDPPLKGRFDTKTLLYRHRVTAYRYELKDVEQAIGERRNRKVVLSLAVEFGGESGMAEIQANQARTIDDLGKVLSRFTPKELLTPEGKRRMKEAMVAVLNRRLGTARVRQIYLTDFRLG